MINIIKNYNTVIKSYIKDKYTINFSPTMPSSNVVFNQFSIWQNMGQNQFV